ncbi:hypothetical protein C8R45DRAFT_1001365 [Mycena sanguinolenta]|nr:hypothetical protein C8R45DRAFT_1001365 [Mycena sanguinolenta]
MQSGRAAFGGDVATDFERGFCSSPVLDRRDQCWAKKCPIARQLVPVLGLSLFDVGWKRRRRARRKVTLHQRWSAVGGSVDKGPHHTGDFIDHGFGHSDDDGVPEIFRELFRTDEFFYSREKGENEDFVLGSMVHSHRMRESVLFVWRSRKGGGRKGFQSDRRDCFSDGEDLVVAVSEGILTERGHPPTLVRHGLLDVLTCHGSGPLGNDVPEVIPEQLVVQRSEILKHLCYARLILGDSSLVAVREFG